MSDTKKYRTIYAIMDWRDGAVLRNNRGAVMVFSRRENAEAYLGWQYDPENKDGRYGSGFNDAEVVEVPQSNLSTFNGHWVGCPFDVADHCDARGDVIKQNYRSNIVA